MDDFVGEDNPVRVVEAFVEALDLVALGSRTLSRQAPACPSYPPAGNLNRIPSSRRLEREAQRNLELMWLVGAHAPGLHLAVHHICDPGCSRAA